MIECLFTKWLWVRISSLSGNSLLDYSDFFSPNGYKKKSQNNVIIKLKKKKKRNYLLEEIKHNDLMSEKYKSI